MTEIERALIDELYASGMSESAIARRMQEHGFDRTRGTVASYISRKYGGRYESHPFAWIPIPDYEHLKNDK